MLIKIYKSCKIKYILIINSFNSANALTNIKKFDLIISYIDQTLYLPKRMLPKCYMPMVNSIYKMFYYET